MTKRGEQHAQAIRDGLTCPACQYSLRGLLGDDINCPECGQRMNIPGLMSAKWSKPWWEAPLYNTLALPVCWAALAVLVLMVIGTLSRDIAHPRATALAWTAFAAIAWLFLLAYMQKRFGSAEGIWLSLLLHLVVPFYLVGIIGALGMTIRFVSGLRTLWIVSLYNGLGLALFLGLIIAARLLERFVGQRCIRRHTTIMADSA